MENIPGSLFGAIIGIATHHGLFIHGEWHVQAPNILMVHLICFTVLSVVNRSGWQIITAAYLLSLFLSIISYRVLFHRLKEFPGPTCAAVSKVWHLWKARRSKNHIFLTGLNRKYGDFVRTGPSEITVFHPDIFMAIDGPRSKCSKGEWYDLLHPDRALVNARDSAAHRPRRRIWKQGFTSKALLTGKDQAISLINQLDRCIQADIAYDRVSEVSDLVAWLSFDRMAQFVLGKSFNMLEHPEWRFMVQVLQRALRILGPLSPTPWVVQIVLRLFPRVMILKDWFGMLALCKSELTKIKEPAERNRLPSLGYYLMQPAWKDSGEEIWLAGDSLLAFVAGSEPTAGVLLGLFYELARNPVQADIIYRELQEQGVDATPAGRDRLPRCQHLEGAIFESLRLYPSLPTGGNRKTPANEGITVAGVLIPPDTTVVAPRFCISRREDCFAEPNEFVPERWTTRPEMVRNRSAFTPFGIGYRSCLGRALAMNDMMLVAAHIIGTYRIDFPPGETGDNVFDDWRDVFTSCLGRLRLKFEPRHRKT